LETLEVLLAHRLHFLLASIGCEPIQQVKAWQEYELTDVSVKVVIYEAFVGGKLDSQTPHPRRA